ncbi:phage terminase small subunit [Comamonas resistens]|uniref:phage terminase small subunit n=1 Tax=Comamonas resistens TaxID=3046670 RepID=UPI0039BCC282
MRKTPAQQHMLRVMAEQQAAQAAASNPHGETQGTAYELQLAQLYEFKKRLRDVQSMEGKARMKATMLPEMAPYLDGVLAADAGTQDEVLVTALVWSIDAGEYRRALQLAEYAVRHDLKMPDQYQRTMATALQDEFADAVLSGALVGDEAMDIAGRVLQLTDALDSHDQAKAKLYKAGGYALLGKTTTNGADLKAVKLDACQKALPLLRQAMALHPGIGVKKDIERLEQRLKAAGLPLTQAP